MEIKQEFNFYDLENNCWSGALETLETIETHNEKDGLFTLLQEVFGEVPTLTQVNDFLWFDSEWIYEQLGINEEEEEGEENE